MPNKITFFVSGNGDSVLLQAHDRTVMTDINYRVSKCQDPDDHEAPDFAPDIRSACPKDHLNVFILTHPDQDHLAGFGEIFHLGPPDDWTDDPDEGPVKIIVDEIWCSPYAVNPHYTTDASKPVIAEIKRRKKLLGSAAGKKAGNRLMVMDTKSHQSGNVTNGLAWRLLAPTPEEADIPKSDDANNPNSSNPSSLVIQWTISISSKANYVLLGGDSTVEVWERIHDEVLNDRPSDLAWHILLAPHHCSRRSIGRVENSGTSDEKFVPSDRAEAALGEQKGNGHVVSSSNRIVRGGSTPPSFHAKNRYLKILAGDAEVTDDVRERFRCTGGEKSGDKPDHVEFKFSSKGPTKSLAVAATITGTGSASGRGGGYGEW